jgi:crotonobetainyl-CoA:carnitine CoA-transferase CaiB-like acyl-CoA transferase
MTAAPLAGVRVVEFAEGVAGPLAARLLADAGADVIKIETATGDRARNWVPQRGGVGVVFDALNRSKRAAVIDPGSSEWSALVGLADVLIIDQELAAARGVDVDGLVESHGRLIACVISGWGPQGPWAERPGGELPSQLAAETTASLGRPGEEPVRLGADHAGTVCAIDASQAVIAALIADVDGGQRIDVSLFGSSLHMRTALWVALSNPDEWHGFHLDSYTKPPEEYYTCSDRRIWFSVSRVADMATLCRDLKMEFVFDDPRWPMFKTDGGGGLGRYSHLVKDLWDRGLSQWTADEAEEIIVGHGGWVGQCFTYDELAADPQVQHLGLFVDTGEERGAPVDVRPPWEIREVPTPPRRPSPELDEHRSAIGRDIIATGQWAVD